MFNTHFGTNFPFEVPPVKKDAVKKACWINDQYE